MCLELLADVEPVGGFADLGCGAGALAIAAALLGFEPVDAVDSDEPSVAAARDNARRNGVEIRAHVLDLHADRAPAARVVAANVPAAVHAGVAAGLPEAVERVIVSGIRPESRGEVLARYEARGLTLRDEREEGGWLALELARAEGLAAEGAKPGLAAERREPGHTAEDRQPGLAAEDREPRLAAENREPRLAAEDREPGHTAEDRGPGHTAERPKPGLAAEDREPRLAAEGPKPGLAAEDREPGLPAEDHGG
jgi:SAM-dependent methyltransferase